MPTCKRVAYYKNEYTIVVEDLDAELEEDDSINNPTEEADEAPRTQLSVISPLEKKLKRDFLFLLLNSNRQPGKSSGKSSIPSPDDFKLSVKYSSSSEDLGAVTIESHLNVSSDASIKYKSSGTSQSDLLMEIG